jgi:cytochrome c oxidase assembly factor CtaG
MSRRTMRAVACTLGIATVGFAQLSPLEGLAHRSFAAHMLQHLALMLVAAPLLVWGRAGVVVLRSVPPEWRPALTRAGRWMRTARRPAVVWILFAAALWGWHLPGPYQAALSNAWIHVAEHVSFFGTAVLWWACLLGRRRLEPGGGMLYAFTTMVHAAWLAAILTFAPHVLYPYYALRAVPGLTALADQQLAGVLMWVPAGFVYVGVIVAEFFRLFATVEARVRRAEAVLP